MTKTQLLKVYRAAVRLRHSLDADEELRTGLPALEAAIDKAATKNKEYVLDIKKVLEEGL